MGIGISSGNGCLEKVKAARGVVLPWLAIGRIAQAVAPESFVIYSSATNGSVSSRGINSVGIDRGSPTFDIAPLHAFDSNDVRAANQNYYISKLSSTTIPEPEGGDILTATALLCMCRPSSRRR